MNFNEAAQEIHRTAVANGFWDRHTRLSEKIALAHSELSEAYEAWRDSKFTEHDYDLPSHRIHMNHEIGVELVDCIIVCLDMLAAGDCDVDSVLQKKMEKNKQRPIRHGRGI